MTFFTLFGFKDGGLFPVICPFLNILKAVLKTYSGQSKVKGPLSLFERLFASFSSKDTKAKTF